MSRKWLVAAGSGLAAAILIASAAAAVGTNGSFEVGGPLPLANNWRTLAFGTPAADDITDWAVVSGRVDWVGTYWQASQGTHSIDLNGNTGPGAISQTFATVIGEGYTVSFDLSGNPDDVPPAVDPFRTVNVSATGGATASYSYDMVANLPTKPDMKWEAHSYIFVATATTTTLTFASTTPNVFYGPALDNVVITEGLPTAANCKKGGWTTFPDLDGNTFKNQGDCVSFFATDGRNPGAGS